MKTKLSQLIEKSPSLSPEKMALYLQMLQFLTSQQQNFLKKIFTDEEEFLKNVEIDKNHQKSDLNRNFISEVDSFFNTQHKLALQSEEKSDKQVADILISNI